MKKYHIFLVNYETKDIEKLTDKPRSKTYVKFSCWWYRKFSGMPSTIPKTYSEAIHE